MTADLKPKKTLNSKKFPTRLRFFTSSAVPRNYGCCGAWTRRWTCDTISCTGIMNT